jgi:hypothetical protein
MEGALVEEEGREGDTCRAGTAAHTQCVARGAKEWHLGLEP